MAPKPKLSPEEKKALKAEKKAKKKLAAEMKKRQIRKDHLDREVALGEKTWKELKEKWRVMLMKMRIPQMQEDLKTLKASVERWLDAKNFHISLLMDEIDEFVAQSDLIAQGHVAAMDRLLAIYLQRVQDLHDEFSSKVEEVKQIAEEEFSTITEREDKWQEYLKAMLFNMETKEDEEEDFMRSEWFCKLDDEKSKNTEKRQVLRGLLELKLESRWSEITGTLIDYQESTESRRNHFAQLKAKDNFDSQMIYDQMKRTQKLFDIIREMRRILQFDIMPDEVRFKLYDLRSEKQKFLSAYKQFRRYLKAERDLDYRQLLDLSTQSTQIMGELKRMGKKGEYILKLNAICRKYETQYEKVCPIGLNIEGPNQEIVKRDDGSSIEYSVQEEEEGEATYDEPIAALSEDYTALGMFWKKVGKANLSRLGLMRCVRELQAENCCLKAILRSYLINVSRR